MKKMDAEEIFGLGENPNETKEVPNHIGLYQKCLLCKDYGVSCNGPKLAALGDIMVVREFHRAIRVARKITLKAIADAAANISEYTVNDYFSHSVKDFKWTTVGAIDNALTSICGGRVGQPLSDNPCPASTSEIAEQIAAYEARLEEANREIARIQEKYSRKDASHIAAMEDQRRLFERMIDHLKSQLQKEEDQKKDYLRRIDSKNRIIAALVVAAVISFLTTTAYFIWDILHVGVGPLF